MVKKFQICFGSEFRFLHKPLNLWSRLLLLAAAATIAASLFFPLWKMHLVAPQYSDGLDLYIFRYKIQGGGLNGQHLVEINNLNHYIGMKPIQEADFMEMRWMPFVFGLIILMMLRSVVFGEMSNVVDLFAVYCLLRHLFDRLVLVPALPIRAQSRSARADAHQAVYAAADRRETNRKFPRIQFPAGSALICFVFRCCSSCSPAGFRERSSMNGERTHLRAGEVASRTSGLSFDVATSFRDARPLAARVRSPIIATLF